MNEAEHELARKIIHVLDDDGASLRPALREQLAAARRTALAQYQEQPVRSLALAGALEGGGTYSERQTARFRLLLVAAALLCAVALGLTWHKHSQTDIAEIDAGLLSDELPINAYLDRGFDSWLKRVSR